jgi:hypothetical protein
MPTVQELYELWADESERPGQLVLDVGARNARHTIRLIREHVA